MKEFSFQANGKPYSVPVLNAETVSPQETDRICREKQGRYILDCGQNQITHKAYYVAQEMEKLGIHTVFFARDDTGLSDENIQKEGLDVQWIPRSFVKAVKKYRAILKQYKPLHVELFLGVRPDILLFIVLYTRLKGIPLVSRCRGGEILNWKKHRAIRRWVNAIAFRLSKLMLVRELFMCRDIVELKIADIRKVYLLHNHVPVPEHVEKPDSHEILYLNSLKSFRNPGLMIDVAEKLSAMGIDYTFTVVGWSGGQYKAYGINDEEAEFTRRLEQSPVKDRFTLQEFTNDTVGYFERARVFFLPADLVFCNFSLIEAMSYRCVPVIIQTDGAKLIVEDGVSGYITDKDADQLTERVAELLKDDALAAEMGHKAREKIIEEFNCEKTTKVLLALYDKMIWKGRGQ